MNLLLIVTFYRESWPEDRKNVVRQYIMKYRILKNSIYLSLIALQWRHNGWDGVSNHRRLDCLLNRVFRRRSNKTSKLRVTAFSEANSPIIGEFPAQRNSYAENTSIWWRHHAKTVCRWDVVKSRWSNEIRYRDTEKIILCGNTPSYVHHYKYLLSSHQCIISVS